MRPLNNETLRGLLADPKPPCISVYMPTARSIPDKQQNSVRFGNLVKQVEQALEPRVSSSQSREMLEPFRALGRDADFWNHATDGVAVLAGPGRFEVFRLRGRIPERVVINDSFHLKPLIRSTQATGRYQVLCVGRRQVKLYEGDRDALEEIPMEEIPERVAEIRSEEATTKTKAVDPFGNELGDPFTPEGEAAVYQSGGNTGDMAAVAERFFRAVDRVVTDRYSKPSGVPLVLAALPEHHAHFRKTSHNPNLVASGIEIDPFSLSPDDLRQRAWKILEPQFEAHRARLTEEYGAAQARGLGTSDLADAAKAVVAGRIATLLVEDGLSIPGRIDRTTGDLIRESPNAASGEDALDDLAELALRMGAQVLVLPRDQMPGNTGLAATYRF